MPHEMRRTPSQTSASPPASPYYASNQTSQAPAPTRHSKADQIVQNFYSKVAQIITQARLIQYDSLSIGNIPPVTNLAINPRQASHHSKRPNKWFNLEMWDSDVYKEDLRYWRHTATPIGNPMIIEFFLDTSELPKNKILVMTDEMLRRSRVDVHSSGESEDGKSKNILLESWQLTLSHPPPDSPPDLPVVYKKSIAFFRSLYAYVRLLPAFRLYKRIKMKLNNALKIGYRFVLPNNDYVDDIGIDVPIIEGETSNVSSQFSFCPIDTPLGALSLKVNYRTNCEFHIDVSAEEILSANFMVDFDEQFFTPTVAKYYQEQEQRKQVEKEERQKSVSTKMNTPPSGYLFPGNSPQYNNLLLGGTPPLRSLSSPRSNLDTKGYSNTELSFPKIYTPPSRLPPSTFASTLSSNTAPLRSSDSRRSFETPRSGRYDNLSSSRPNVTLVQPFKSPYLSSSPSQTDNLPSPTFSERSSPLYRSPSSLSLQQRGSSSRPLSLNGGATLSSSVKSNSSAENITKFSSSFSSYRQERNSGSSGRESVNGRKRSRSSLTNRSDGSGGSFNSSFFASLDPDNDVGEFVRLVDTREPLKMFSRSPTGSDDSGSSGGNMSGSAYRSKQSQLSRFRENKESHNTLSDSITSMTLQSIPQQLEPPSGLALGTLSGSTSSSITSSMSKSTTHPPNVPSRLSENVTLDKQEREEFIMPKSVRIPQTNSGKTREPRPRRSSSISLDKGTEIGMMQTDNIIIRDYSSYSNELGVGMSRVDSNSSLTSSQSKLNYEQHSRQQTNNNREINNEIIVGEIKSNTESINIPKSKVNAFNDVLITERITGSPASGNSLRVQEEEMFFKLDEPILGEGANDGTINSDAQVDFPVKASADGVNNNETTIKYEAINNNTLKTTTENNQEKITRTDEEL